MADSRFGYLDFVPHTPTEMAFVKTEENDAVGCRIRAIIEACHCCVNVPGAKGLSESMEVKPDDQKVRVIQCSQ